MCRNGTDAANSCSQVPIIFPPGPLLFTNVIIIREACLIQFHIMTPWAA